MKRVLVTGGLGFVGSRLATTLAQRGDAVTIVDHRTDVPQPAGMQDVRIADVSRKDFWDALTEPFDAIMHQAACTDTTVTDREAMLRHNLQASMHMLDWACAHAIDVVYASSAATYGNGPSPQRVGEHEEPLNVYGESKLLFDRHVRTLLTDPPVKIIGLRYFNVYGPGEAAKGKMASMICQLAAQMKAGKRPRIFFDGNQKRDQIYVDDIVAANIAALDAAKDKSGIYNAGTGHAVSFNEIIASLNDVLGTALEPEYFKNPYSFYQTHTEADIAATRSQLSFTPRFTLTDGVRAYHASGTL